MKWAAIIVRTLVGLGFTAIGIMFFVVPMPDPPTPPDPTAPVTKMGEALTLTGYMTVIKILELVGGLLLLSGRYVPVGLLILTPIAVNILLWDVFLVGKPVAGPVLLALLGFLIFAYRKCFIPDARL